MWGRSVYENVQKFLQFQLVVNVVALVLTFVAACLNHTPPLNPIMMLWVNLIMDTMGALALATEVPTRALLARRPYAASASLVTPRMWRFIAFNSALQLVLVLGLVEQGAALLGVNRSFLLATGKWLPAGRSTIADHTTAGTVEETEAAVLRLKADVDVYMSTFIFNYFVFAQIFNEFNARELGDDVFGALRGITGNPMFGAVIAVSVGLQALFVEFGGAFFKTTGLTAAHWGITVGLASTQLVVGALLRLVPVPTRAKDFASFYVDWFATTQAAAAPPDATRMSIVVRTPSA